MCKIANNNILSYATQRLEQISKGKYYVYKSSTTERCVGKSICVPLCCSPCIIWGCSFRILCIPIKGCNAIGGVDSTECCDNCVIKLCEEYDKKVPDWINYNIKTTSAEDLGDIIQGTLEKIKNVIDHKTLFHILTFISPIYSEYCVKTNKTEKVLLVSCLHSQLKEALDA